jgi:hypothetical protein
MYAIRSFIVHNVRQGQLGRSVFFTVHCNIIVYYKIRMIRSRTRCVKHVVFNRNSYKALIVKPAINRSFGGNKSLMDHMKLNLRQTG